MYNLKFVILFFWGLYLGIKVVLYFIFCFRYFIDLGYNVNYKYVKMGGYYLRGCRLWLRSYLGSKELC